MRQTAVLCLAAILAAGGCRRPAESATTSTAAVSPAVVSEPLRDVQSMLPAADEFAAYEAKRASSGSQPVAFKNLTISGIAVKPLGDGGVEITAKATNTSSDKVTAAICDIDKSRDDRGNELNAPLPLLLDLPNDAIAELSREMQPGESKTIRFHVWPKLKSANHGTLWISTHQGLDEPLAKWMLEFDFPPAN